jgi:hypothetical protein
MAALLEPADPAEHDVIETAIIGARIIDPEIVDGKIIGGRIVGGRVVDAKQLRHRARHALHFDRQSRHTEVIAVVGLCLALLMMYML